MVKMFLVRLLSVTPIKWRTPAQPEIALSIAFANHLRALTLDGKLKGVWTHIPNEIGWGANDKKAQFTYALAKNMGMIVGSPDYVFLKSDGALALEAKSKTGRQHEGQKDFEQWCAEQGVPYRIFRTIEEAIAILIENDFLEETK